ncbi:MAG: aminotransferase class I/II-fold pyridoxal phosphate-dependent enzyme [Raoultibacter sp.]
MIPLAIPNLTGNERRYLNECIDTTFVSSVGAFVNRLEGQVAEKTGSTGAVATSAGTTALHLALMQVGVTSNDLVILPSFTFIASANSISHCGATPWFLDVTEENWTLDPQQLADELRTHAIKRDGGVYHRETNRRIAAVMPVYTLGNVADMDAINAIAQAYDLPVVADAACALGARYKGRSLGGLAKASAASFNGNKTVTAGGGGAVFGDDSALLSGVKHVSSTARVWPEYDFDQVGYNYRMTNIQAAVGCAQLERLEEFVEKKRSVRDFYARAFEGISGTSLFPVADFCESSCWFSGVVFDVGGLEKLHGVEALLKEKGVESRTFWKPAHMQLPYLGAPQAASLLVSEHLWDRILTLPCSTGITDEELSAVVSAVKAVL